MASTFYNSSELSAQEAACNLLRIPMTGTSEKVVFIPSGLPDERKHILKPREALDNMNAEDENIFEEGLIEHYVARPTDMDDLTLTQFAAWYELSRTEI